VESAQGTIGRIVAVSVSDRKGVKKTNVETAQLLKDHGLENDAHAGRWHSVASCLCRRNASQAGPSFSFTVTSKALPTPDPDSILPVLALLFFATLVVMFMVCFLLKIAELPHASPLPSCSGHVGRVWGWVRISPARMPFQESHRSLGLPPADPRGGQEMDLL